MKEYCDLVALVPVRLGEEVILRDIGLTCFSKCIPRIFQLFRAVGSIKFSDSFCLFLSGLRGSNLGQVRETGRLREAFEF